MSDAKAKKKMHPFFSPKAAGVKRPAVSSSTSSTSSAASSSSKAVKPTTAALSAPSKNGGGKRAKVAGSPPSSAAGGESKQQSGASSSETLLSLDALHPSWVDALGKEEAKPYFGSLNTFVEQEYRKGTVFPPKDKIFSAFTACPFDKVRVVVLGQDPYHGPGQAHGLAFSVEKGIAIPPSLRNMIKEAVQDVGITKPGHGNLQHWSEQGVLLLNTCLTVRKAQANSHQKHGWETFTDAVIKALNKREEGLVFLLWGKPAQKKSTMISKSRHRVLTCAHPSPLSATRGKDPFIGSKIFSKTNAILEKLGNKPIDWAIPE